MDFKPIITYAGDAALFSGLSSSIVESLPQEPTEWRRSYGRAVKTVYLEASFVPFSVDTLSNETKTQLLHQPIFHIYWTECVDIDLYKTSVRDDIETWMKQLTQRNIRDWMIVIVETYDLKKSNKLLPRTTVLDKIRNDFASKNGDRCMSVINPVKSESKSADSWRGLLERIRVLVLSAYDRTLLKFEEIMREQRERRNEPGWSFCQYFLLQEELAFVLEMLGIYDEALVQYDELDALFTQFVLNSNVADTPAWLNTFQCPFENWTGITLGQTVNQNLRSLLVECRASLIEFRSYLFSRQCAMLLLMFKPWEIAQRSLPFLHNCIKELEILEISTPEGSVACWVFLCCLEVLHTCERFNDSGQVEAYSLYTASLWAYARDKLRELGELCGLMPDHNPTSEQLHLVVGLSAGMGDSLGDSKQLTPIDKLKEALSSKEAFKKHYLELAELAMGTYKHIGRIRSARLIGRDLAEFYLCLNEPQKAAVFLIDVVKTFEEENWKQLAVQTHVELANCYKKMGDWEKYIKTCSIITCSSDLDYFVRIAYFDEMLKSLEGRSIGPVVTSFNDAFHIKCLELQLSKPVICDSVVELLIKINSNFPRDIKCVKAAISVSEVKEIEKQNSSGIANSRSQDPEKRSSSSKKPSSTTQRKESVGDKQLHRCTSEDLKPENPALVYLKMIEHLDYKQDKSLSSASMVSENPKQFLRRTDSHGKYRKISTTTKCDFSSAFVSENFILKPGENTFIATTKAQEKGLYRLGQLSITLTGNIEFLSSVISPKVGFEVIQESSSVMLMKGESDLLAGIEQEMTLTVSAGSHTIEDNTCLKFRTSRGLLMQVKRNEEPLSREFAIPLPNISPFESLSLSLRVLAELPPQKDNNTIEHKVTMICPWYSEEKIITLHFQPPFMSTYRLHTAQARKFVQIMVLGLNSQILELSQPKFNQTTNQDISLVSLNPTSGQKLLVGNGMNVSFMWELQIGNVKDTSPIKTEFCVNYQPIRRQQELQYSGKPGNYKCNFDITDYKTLYVVKSLVEPMKGSEFCRAGTMCHLQLYVQRVNPSSHNSLMYEVLADQTMWAVCGRTAGVISLDSVDEQNVTLDVMPLMGGYLPLPSIRLSKYIPADQKSATKELSSQTSHPRLEPFSPGQVYNSSKAQQVHVIPSVTASMATESSLP